MMRWIPLIFCLGIFCVFVALRMIYLCIVCIICLCNAWKGGYHLTFLHVLFYLIKKKSSFEPFVCQPLSCPWISYLIFLHHCSILENPLDQHKTEMFSALKCFLHLGIMLICFCTWESCWYVFCTWESCWFVFCTWESCWFVFCSWGSCWFSSVLFACSVSVYSTQGADLPIVAYQQIMTIALSNGMNALVMIAGHCTFDVFQSHLYNFSQVSLKWYQVPQITDWCNLLIVISVTSVFN